MMFDDRGLMVDPLVWMQATCQPVLCCPQTTIMNSLEHSENDILIKNNLAVYLFIKVVAKWCLSAPVGHSVAITVI